MYEQWQIDPTSSQGGPLSSGTSSISHELHNTIHNTEVEQPRSQGPLLPIPWSKSERETLENVGHVYPRTWEMTKHNIEGGAGKSGVMVRVCSPSPYVRFCHLPDSGRHVISVFQGLSLSHSRGWEGEDPGNEVGG